MRSVRYFVIAFIMSLAVFGFLAYNIVNAVFSSQAGTPGVGNETTDSMETQPETNDRGQIITPKDEYSELTFILIGTDYLPSVFDDYGSSFVDGVQIEGRKTSADALILVKISRKVGEKGTVVFSSIPTNTIMNQTLNTTIDDLYADKGGAYIIECVYALTGIRAQFCASLSAEDSLKVFDKIGSVVYSVPCDLYYVDENVGMNLDLKKGLNTLKSDQILSMLRFNHYENTTVTRNEVLVGFAKVVVQKMTSASYYNNAVSTFKELIKSFETDFTLKDFQNYQELIFDIPEFQMRTVTYPGTNRDINGRRVFIPNITNAVSVFLEYK